MPRDRTRSKPAGLPIIHPFAAGIDIGSRFHVVAVSPDLSDEPVQTFQAFTGDLQRMADWLVATGTKTVVMESTGVYWVAAYEVLESRGLEVVLANAREARAVPGRKSDVNDAQWLQRLHACGLLRASFRPGRDIAELRSYLQRDDIASATYALRRSLPVFSYSWCNAESRRNRAYTLRPENFDFGNVDYLIGTFGYAKA